MAEAGFRRAPAQLDEIAPDPLNLWVRFCSVALAMGRACLARPIASGRSGRSAHEPGYLPVHCDWTLAAFAIGALAGMLIRRVVPAMVATLAAYAGLAFAAGLYLRPHYLTPLVARNLFNPPGSAFVASLWWTKGGKFAFADRPPINLMERFCPPSALGAWQAVGGNTLAVFRPARIYAMDQLPAGQPVLAIPADRGRLAARAVSPAHRRDRLAGPPPRRMTQPPADARAEYGAGSRPQRHPTHRVRFAVGSHGHAEGCPLVQ